MTDGPAREESLTPTEERLLRYLLLLRLDGVRAEPLPTDAVMRRVRLQYALAGVVRALASLARALLDGLSLVLGRGSARR